MKYPEVSLEVWSQNYQAEGEVDLLDTWKRQAKACSSIEKEEIRDKVYEDFLWLLSDFKGIAGGRITANLGVKGREATTNFNCFVHAPADINYKDIDSINGIYDMLKAQAQTLKSEGGYGMNFSWIRPAGSYVKGIDGRTPGVLKFMELWDKSSEIITMGSEKIVGERRSGEKKKMRKGAQMAVLCCWHPEIEDFIDAKLVEGRLSKFNISVGITDGFMEAVDKDLLWNLKFPDTTHSEYKGKWNGRIEDWEALGFPTITHRTVRARDLWEKIMRSTYTRNDPGVLFLDLANKLNPLAYGENIQTTNPCGEIAMSTGVCLLFSLNLVKFIKKQDDRFVFDFNTFEKAVSVAIRFADNINDLSTTPLDEYTASLKEKRRIGVGVLGLGSLHYVLGIRFGSSKSINLIKDIFQTKAEAEILTSAKLGKEKGSFELFDKDKYFNTYWWKNLPISDEIKAEVELIGEMRNSHRSANAPTGNMSIYAGCVSGGIEPVFEKEYYRWVIVTEGDRALLREEGFKFPDVFKGEWFETEDVKFSKAGEDSILLGTFNNIDYQLDKNRGLTKKVLVKDWGWEFVKNNLDEKVLEEYKAQNVFATTSDLSVEDHINTLKVLSTYVDMNSSKTVNIPNDYSYEDFKDLYLDAYNSGIKGITSYRAGTMTAVLESLNDSSYEEQKDKRFAPTRPAVLSSETHKVKIDFGDGTPKNAYVTVSFSPNSYKPYEVFVQAPNGLDEKDLQILELTTRNASMNLRHGIPLQYVCEQMEKINGQYVFSIPTNIARILRKYEHTESQIKESAVEKGEISSNNSYRKCPSCNNRSYILVEGCGQCINCSYSGCG